MGLSQILQELYHALGLKHPWHPHKIKPIPARKKLNTKTRCNKKLNRLNCFLKNNISKCLASLGFGQSAKLWSATVGCKHPLQQASLSALELSLEPLA